MVPRGTSPSESRARSAVFIVDDHPIMRAGLAQLINRQADLKVVGEADAPAPAMRGLAKEPVDLLLTDMAMSGRGGLEFIKDVHASHPALPILVVSMHDEMVYAERALRAGARGYLMKESGGEALLTAIRQVLEGHVYVSPRMSAQLIESFSGRKQRDSNSPFGLLTDREFEIYQLIGQGKNTRQIAEELGLSSKTVDVHRSNVKTKLGVPDTTALVRHAVHWLENQGGQNR